MTHPCGWWKKKNKHQENVVWRTGARSRVSDDSGDTDWRWNEARLWSPQQSSQRHCYWAQGLQTKGLLSLCVCALIGYAPAALCIGLSLQPETCQIPSCNQAKSLQLYHWKLQLWECTQTKHFIIILTFSPLKQFS